MSLAAKDAGLSIHGTVKEMMALQQSGELVSSKVLPFFAKRLREAAQANKGLKNALKGNRVAMNRLITTYQMAADDMFKNGLGDGLTDFFNDSAKMLKELTPLWKALGKIIGGVFKIISVGVRLITPVLATLGHLLKFVTDILGDFSGAIAVMLGALYVGKIQTMVKAIWGMNAAVGATNKGLLVMIGRMAALLWPITAVLAGLAALEETYALATGQNKETVLFGNTSKPDAMKNAGIEMLKGVGFGATGGWALDAGMATANWLGLNNSQKPVQSNVTVVLDTEKVGAGIAHTAAMTSKIEDTITTQGG